MNLFGAFMLAAFLVLTCASNAVAFHVPPWDTGHQSFDPNDPDNDTDPGDDGPNQCGSPVQVANGNFVYDFRLLRISGVGPDLDVTLTYNSEDMRDGLFGNGWNHPYDHRIVETTDGVNVFAICGQPDGKRVRFRRNSDNSFAPPPNVFSQLVRNTDGTWLLTEKDGSQRRFDANGLLSAIVDRYGNTLTVAYDATGFATRIQGASARAIDFVKGADGRVASLTDPAGRTFRFAYDQKGNLIRSTDPMNFSVNYSYDTKNNLTAITDARGNTTTRLTYDLQNRVATHTEGQEVWTYTYSPSVRRTTKRDSSGQTWTFDYNDAAAITSRRFPLNGVETLVYDTNLNVTSLTNKNGRTTTTTYDALGNPLKITDALGGTHVITYDPIFNKPLTVQDARGNLTTFQYDARGSLTRITNPLGQQTTFQYDARGLLAGITDPLGQSSTFTYDANGNRIRSIDPVGSVREYAFDVLGRGISERDPENRVTQNTYDLNGRLTRVDNPLNGSTLHEYDQNGNETAVTVAGGARTTFTYDIYNRLMRLTNAAGQSTSFTYDKKDNLASRTDARGMTISYTYDAIDRLIRKTRPEDIVSYTYDTQGNLLTLADGDSSLTFAYDALDRLIDARTAATAGQPATQIRYSYDADGNRISMTDPAGGVTNYTYDALSRMTAMTNPFAETFSFTYDNLSRRISSNAPGGLFTSRGYDAGSRLLTINHQGGAGPLAMAYTYDRVGNRLTATDENGAHGYTYDALYRTTSATHSAGSPPESYVYDPTNNRLASHLSASYTYGPGQRLTADATFNYDYDANGNLIRKLERATNGTTLYTYDSENQLTRIDFPDATFATYRYDGLGRRIEKVASGATTRYVYDDQDIIAEYSGTGLTASYTQGSGIDDILAVRRGGSSYFFQTDALGSVHRTVTAAGVQQHANVYDSFGRILSATGAPAGPYAFQGREYDAESGLYYMRARYYDPNLGRFISEDPLVLEDGPNPYAFTHNNPVNLIDPFGLEVGFWESLIPVWGPAHQAYDDFACGRWGWGLFNTALAITDLIPAKALGTALAKGAFKSGSHTWGATRAWYGATRELAAGQPVHHWLIPRNGWGKTIPEAIKNQPWNLMPIDPPPGFSYNQWHNAIEGKRPFPLGPAGRAWHGTPGWAKGAAGSVGGRATNAARGGNDKCDCK
jgi:RHS repeat-associated protein